jgi:cyclopropane-fatty-acyl-phospholipid synthase
VKVWWTDYLTSCPKEKYDALISIEMIDHLCSPAQANQGLAIEIYREYFKKCAEWVKPGECFGFQAILRNRVPRAPARHRGPEVHRRRDLPGRPQPPPRRARGRGEPVLGDRRAQDPPHDYGKTTGEWLRRMRLHEKHIRERWGDQVFDDYDRYLSTCVRAFANHWSSDVQMKLRHIDV